MTPSLDFPKVLGLAKRATISAGLSSLLVNVLQLTMPMYMMQVFDRVLASGSYDTLFYLSLIGALALLVASLLDAARTAVMTRVGVWIERRLSSEMFARAVEAALARKTYAAEAARDLGTVRNFVGSSGALSLLDVPWVPIYIVIVWMLHPALGILTAVGAVLLFALALVAEVVTRRPLREGGAATRAATTVLLAVARHAEAVDAMGMTHGLSSRWRARNDAGLAHQTRAADLAAGVLAVTKFARMGLQMAVLGVGAALVVEGHLTGGAMIAGSILMSRGLAPVEQAIGIWKQLVAARGALERLHTFFAAPMARANTMPLPAPAGRLAVERVSLVHHGHSRHVLRDVSFALEPGEAIAVTGPSAAGKSSLARLILGTWRATAGTVRLDGADVHQWNRGEFGRHVGYLPQDIELFAGTVGDNIARMAGADPAKIVEAAQMAKAHKLILALPQGYDTEIGDGGVLLSGGQRQRIALARALFGCPRLVVLDEPDSNLDRDGEDSLCEAILTMKESGACVVVIAHRAHLLDVVDKVLVLRGGMVDLLGPVAEVRARLAGAPMRRAVTAQP